LHISTALYVVNLHIKLEVHSCSRSGDMEGIPEFSRTPQKCYGATVASVSQRWGTELYQILGGHIALVAASQVCVRCQVCCLFLKLECLKVQNQATFRHILPLP